MDVVNIEKRKKIENFELHALRDVVKKNTENVVESFEETFKKSRAC